MRRVALFTESGVICSACPPDFLRRIFCFDSLRFLLKLAALFIEMR
jgi:hypothetical protein